MKRPLSGAGGFARREDDFAPRHRFVIPRGPRRAFTLIEVMVVVGIMGLVATVGYVSLGKLLQKTGMRKVVSDVVEVCSRARAQAILRGVPTDVVFHPRERNLAVEAAPSAAAEGGMAAAPAEAPAPTAGSGHSAQIPEDIIIEMLDINLSEYKESDWARVRFHPNGTSDELTLILRSSKNEWKKISLEVTTGLASVDDVR